MKRLVIIVFGVLLLFLASLAGAKNESTCRLTLELKDSSTGEIIPGVFQIRDDEDRIVPVATALDRNDMPFKVLARGSGLKDTKSIHEWNVISDRMTLNVPRKKVSIDAFSGIETERASRTIDLTNSDRSTVTLELETFSSMKDRGYRSANTHLHLMNFTREESDRYLMEVPNADRLDILFVSHLERAIVDQTYITNRYTQADFDRMTAASPKTIYCNGEEHRHNFEAQGRGFGHVMLLDLKRLIQPVSIGPGITKNGTDGLPLQRGIDQARNDGATVIWCHNDLGTERVVNQVTNRLDAQNIFDGSAISSYKDSFYRTLNAGMNIPFSTGTDWFIYDFSRAYAKVEGTLSTKSWLAALKAGRSFITNGPLIEFRVAGSEPGEVVRLNDPKNVTIEAKIVGRINFEQMEIVKNGHVLRSVSSQHVKQHFESAIQFEIRIDEPCWFALRTPPPLVDGDPELTDQVPLNEYGQPLFGHSSAVRVEFSGQHYFEPQVAEKLLAEIRTDLQYVEARGQFADATEKARVTDVYHDAIATFEKKLGFK